MYHVIHLQLKITRIVFNSVVTFGDLGEFLRHFTHEILNKMKQWYNSLKVFRTNIGWIPIICHEMPQKQFVYSFMEPVVFSHVRNVWWTWDYDPTDWWMSIKYDLGKPSHSIHLHFGNLTFSGHFLCMTQISNWI